jgi:squalene-associated FAD-dependent desaturase
MSEASGSKGRAFVVGAGLAGLAAATALAARGVKVFLFEAAGQAGGRCRSYFDAAFDGVIDNGNHLVLSGNHAIHGYLARIGARGALTGPDEARVDFADIASGERWSVRPNKGPLPWWVALKSRRVPGTSVSEYAAYARLMFAGRQQTMGDLVQSRGPLWDRLMHPFFLAALNTEPKISSARLAGALLRETFAKGGQACCPRVATPTLAAAFIEPALRMLKQKGADVRLGERLRAITFGARDALALEFSDATVPLNSHDMLVLAVPPWVAKDLVPDLHAPDQFRAIVNAHFKFQAPAHLLKQDGSPAILGVIGGMAEWIFCFADRISVTVSAAEAIVDKGREELAQSLWADVCAALKIEAPLPVWQIVKEKRATFAATPDQDARRPSTATGWRNVFLAGDWVQTGLPATIEGAVRSGDRAAALALRQLSL